MYQATINDKETLEFEHSDFDWDLIAINERSFHILYQHRSYEATILEMDAATKTVQVQIGANTYAIALKNKFDLLAEKLGFSSMNSQKLNHIKAPMPGLVLEVLVKEGDAVAKGDSVLILEAMKMENVIKADGDAVVKRIAVDKGAGVEKNQIMIEFDD
jgi:biotin carboxyl carrier protein